ncbi:MAG: hypothetical protein GX813_03625 [Erysipelotrichia bacterium]|nr:hypothetical protein [Erysipelotrichia bacterium]
MRDGFIIIYDHSVGGDSYYSIGDAVCVPVIEWITKYYLNPVVNELIRGRSLRLDMKEA